MTSTASALLTTEEELALVERMLARDERALCLLQERYARHLQQAIVRLVRDEVLAQDLLQEGLLKIWLSIDRYDPARGRLSTWMMRVCCNHAIDALRSPAFRFYNANKSLDGSSAQRAQAPATFNPDHIGLRELTSELKPRLREVIELLYFGGCTQVEAAEQLGIPLATVKTRARTALGVLARVARPVLR
ncbi:RNA polymerase sigma factor [Hymenobacter humi]|uniref:RNA polymerase sigma factor n=1 Tax=Hymenobacter humi TaxID=1411620 RepID=A0ABW2UB55_9BACT